MPHPNVLADPEGVVERAELAIDQLQVEKEERNEYTHAAAEHVAEVCRRRRPSLERSVFELGEGWGGHGGEQRLCGGGLLGVAAQAEIEIKP